MIKKYLIELPALLVIRFFRGRLLTKESQRITKARISRFFVMNGMTPPFRETSGCDSAYWESASIDGNHSSKLYVKPDNVTRETLDPVIKSVNKNASFLEIGCNAGRNLKYLYSRGFRNLAGIEINRIAIEETFKQSHSKVYNAASLFVGNAADIIKNFETASYEVVYSIAVLIHINPEYRALFNEMVRVTQKYIVVFTNELGYPFPYDIQKIFENLGCKQIYHKSFYDGVSSRLPKALFDRTKHSLSEASIRIFIKEVE